MIKTENGQKKYVDRNGKEIAEGCKIKFLHGDKSLQRIEKVYLTEENELGTDATNPVWIEKGWAVPCEYGIFPLEAHETEYVEVEVKAS